MKKSAFYTLSVVVLMGSMAVVALADQGLDVHGQEAFVSAQPEQGVNQPNSGEIREPMETGAVPDRSGSSSELFKTGPGEEPAVESGGQYFRPGIDTGP